MKNLILISALMGATVACAGMPDVSADMGDYYDVTLTTKRLAHSEKTVTKTFTTKTSKGVTKYAFDLFKEHFLEVKDYAGFTVVQLVADGVAFDPATESLEARKITFKYSYFDFKTDKQGNKSYTTKVVSESFKGLYEDETGYVYLWSTASSAKVSVTNGGPNAIVESKKSRGVEKSQSGYAAYQVPLAMARQFVATDDNKAAGGFTGGSARAEDGTELNFEGFTAFGTGTFDSKTECVKSVAGNVAMKDPTDIKYGAYGTWKIQLDSTSKTSKAQDVKEVLRNKGCVELFMERD